MIIVRALLFTFLFGICFAAGPTVTVTHTTTQISTWTITSTTTVVPRIEVTATTITLYATVTSTTSTTTTTSTSSTATETTTATTTDTTTTTTTTSTTTSTTSTTTTSTTSTSPTTTSTTSTTTTTTTTTTNSPSTTTTTTTTTTTASPSCPLQLVVNGGFESGFSPWFNSGGDLAVIPSAQITGGAFEGSFSGCWGSESSDWDDGFAVIAQNYDISGSCGLYSFTLFLSYTSTDQECIIQASVGQTFVDFGGEEYIVVDSSQTSGPNTWFSVVGLVEVKDWGEYSFIEPILQCSQTEAVYIDEISVAWIGNTPNLGYKDEWAGVEGTFN